MIPSVSHGWPKGVELALYGDGGRYVFQALSPHKFDIADVAARLAFTFVPAEFHLGLKAKPGASHRWTESSIRECEETIVYDFTFEGYEIDLTRVKAPSVVSVDEIIWRVNLR